MVSIVTSTIRDNLIDNVFQNYQNQIWEPKELIVILNKNEMDIVKWEVKAKQFKNVTIYQMPEDLTLGECLNFGITKAKFDYIAKFDDDDYYGPYYLNHSMHAFNQTNADIVGKRTAFIYFESRNLLALHTPNFEKRFMTKNIFGHYQLLKGSTLMFKKELLKKVQFQKKNLGEDTDFLIDCVVNGLKIYSTSKYDYVNIRRKNLSDHTWKGTEKKILKKCRTIAQTNNYQQFVVRKPENLN
ncbi:glycosyltransferase [Alkalihalobacterium elongatum]|uniref:glycosyltransferase n=1 Tax=Alkalihalobacterium elongatum TaxID=2675466 RepID=UPI001C1F9F57|nr:glycosyltransferase [Alkalihalobacterium elongatum]